MEKNNKHIDDLFKERLGNYAETPPPAVWDALEKRLTAQPQARPNSAYRWSGYFIMVSALIVLGVFAVKKLGSTAPLPIAVESKNNLSQNDNGMRYTNAKTDGTPKATTNKNNPPITDQTNQPINNNNIQNTSSANTTTPSNTVYNSNAKLPAKVTGISTNEQQIKNHASVASKNNSNPAEKTASANHNKIAAKSATANKLRSSSNKTEGTKSKNLLSHVARTTKPVNTKYLSSSKKKIHPKTSSGSSIDNADNAPALENQYGNNAAGNGETPENIPAPLIPQAPPLPGTFKEEVTEPVKKDITNPVVNNTELKSISKAALRKWEVGVKAGYEGGIKNTTGKKAVVSPYVQYNLSDKFSMMVQPAVKYAHISSQNLNSASFYKENNDSSVSVNSVFIDLAPKDSFKNYVYSQTHDSIVKSYTTGSSYMEFELPVLLKYGLSKNCSVYGGFNMSYNTGISITEHSYTSAPILKTASGPVTFVEANASLAPAMPVSAEITYSGNPLSSYKGPLYTTPAGLFKLGYMLGFNYKYSKRWLFDVLVQQSPVKSAITGGYNTNAPFSAPYFRITLGYRIF